MLSNTILVKTYRRTYHYHYRKTSTLVTQYAQVLYSRDISIHAPDKAYTYTLTQVVYTKNIQVHIQQSSQEQISMHTHHCAQAVSSSTLVLRVQTRGGEASQLQKSEESKISRRGHELSCII